MIKVLIKETGRLETLSIVDQNGIDYVDDFIGNYGAFFDGQFTYADEKDVYACSQRTFDWWNTVITDIQTLENRIAALKEQHGSDIVNEVVNEASEVDLEDLAKSVNTALDEAFSD